MDTLRGKFLKAAYSETRARERMTAEEMAVKAEFGADLADLEFVKILERLDKTEVKVFRSSGRPPTL